MVVLHWPAQAAEVAALAEIGAARLLLVAAEADPPVSVDSREEWIRLPADERDVAARILSLTRRLEPAQRPWVDRDGRLFVGAEWVALSPTEGRLAGVLASSFGDVVTEADLGRGGWPAARPGDAPRWGPNTLRVHLTRLRRRVAPLGLEIRSIRSRGFVMQTAERAGAGVRPEVPRI